jgi:hypothetical protein
MHKHKPLISREFNLMSTAEALTAVSPASSYASDTAEESLSRDSELSGVTVPYSTVSTSSGGTPLNSTVSVLLLSIGSKALPAEEFCVSSTSLSKTPWKLETRPSAVGLTGDVPSSGSVSAALSYSVVSVSEINKASLIFHFNP